MLEPYRPGLLSPTAQVPFLVQPSVELLSLKREGRNEDGAEVLVVGSESWTAEGCKSGSI